MALWRQLRVAPVALFLIAVALSLVRARDQPGLDVSLGGTSASVVPGDVALFALFVLAAAQLRHLRGSRLALASLIVLFAFLLGSAATNGATAFVSGAKLGELAVLTLGGLLVLRSDDRLEALVDVLLLFTLAADAVGVVKFITGGGGRQSSFLGEHDFAALATLPLLYGLTLVFERRRPHRAALAICA